MACLRVKVEEVVALLVLESDHAWESLAAVVFSLEADDVAAEEAEGVDLDLLVAVFTFLGVVLLLKSSEVVR